MNITRKDLDNLELEIGFRGMMAASFDDPDTVGIEQETEMRRAFFGGVKTALDYLGSGLDASDMREECQLFIEGVKKGLW